MKRWLWMILALLMLAALGGALVMVSGVVPIKASSGHWALTAWLLDFAKNRSVATHSIGIHPPDLQDPGLVLRGAGHYHIACMPCHGSPELQHPAVPQYMTPPPPYLPTSVPQWEPEELFYLVKHGIKFTGMPAWPAENRDDEVWAVVAFLLRMPQMQSAEYRALVADQSDATEPLAAVQALGEPADLPHELLASCAACHGHGGRGRPSDTIPLLAGQKPSYLAASLQAYATGARNSGIMKPVARGLRPEERVQLARYFAAMGRGDADALVGAEDTPGPHAAAGTAAGAAGEHAGAAGEHAGAAGEHAGAAGEHVAPSAESDAAAARADIDASVARGAVIALHGVPEQRVPSCADCHPPADAAGVAEDAHPPNPHYPVLAGQHAAYLELQLQLFKQRSRGGTEYAHVMHHVADHLNPEQMRDVTRYYASQRTPAGR